LVKGCGPNAPGILGECAAVTKASVALLALVLVPILLDAGDAQARHSAAVDRALPASELLKAQRVTLASLIDRQKPARNGSNDLRLATDDPASGARGRQAIERQRLPERANDLSRANLLVLKNYRSNLLNHCRCVLFKSGALK